MNFDLEIISEEGDCSDLLFDSIMNAMSSMKEATADKIYQKIQREGETNYSKPQVDRALANALKYGIFEVKNNRYRMRDDILDDEDTVYWKLQRNREQTPFQVQDDINDRQFGPKLDPEKDNQRFRKMSEIDDMECPQCGRTRRPSPEIRRARGQKTKRNGGSPRRRRTGKRTSRGMKAAEGSEGSCPKKIGKKRKIPSTSTSQERQRKIRRKGPKTSRASSTNNAVYLRENLRKQTEEKNFEGGWADVRSDLSDSDLDSASSFSEENQSVSSRDDRDAMKFRKYKKPCMFLSECNEAELAGSIAEGKKSVVSVRSESGSENTDLSWESEGQGGGRHRSGLAEGMGCRSGCRSSRGARERSGKDCGSGGAEECEGKSEWLGCSEEAQGAVIQSNKVLTIEPMDSLAFSSPGQASYIS